MEVRQRMKFTGTNSSIGLIVLILNAHPDGWKTQLLDYHALCRPGGYGGVAAPVPIPNTAVKRPSADGTLS